MTGVAVKVTEVPAQMAPVGLAVMLTLTGLDGFTVTGNTVGEGADTPPLVKFTLIFWLPAVFHVTVAVLSVEVPPEVIVPPPETAQT